MQQWSKPSLDAVTPRLTRLLEGLLRLESCHQTDLHVNAKTTFATTWTVSGIPEDLPVKLTFDESWQVSCLDDEPTADAGYLRLHADQKPNHGQDSTHLVHLQIFDLGNPGRIVNEVGLDEGRDQLVGVPGKSGQTVRSVSIQTKD